MSYCKVANYQFILKKGLSLLYYHNFFITHKIWHKSGNIKLCPQIFLNQITI